MFGRNDKFAKDYILARSLTPAVFQGLAIFNTSTSCDLLSTTRVRLLLVHLYGCAVDNESSTRCHTQAVSRLCRSQARCVDKPFLNAAQTLDEQSANAAVRELECIYRG
jgi:hypothetical protein